MKKPICSITNEQELFNHTAFQAMEQIEQVEHVFFMKTQNSLMLHIRILSKSDFLRVLFVLFVLSQRNAVSNFNLKRNAFHFFRHLFVTWFPIFSSPRAPLCMIFAALKSSTAAHAFTGVHATMMKQHFDATIELEKLNHYCQARRKSHYRRSRLHKCRAELVALTQAGASLRQLVIWLQRNKHIKVSHTSIMRYLKKLPEMHHLEND